MRMTKMLTSRYRFILRTAIHHPHASSANCPFWIRKLKKTRGALRSRGSLHPTDIGRNDVTKRWARKPKHRNACPSSIPLHFSTMYSGNSRSLLIIPEQHEGFTPLGPVSFSDHPALPSGADVNMR